MTKPHDFETLKKDLRILTFKKFISEGKFYEYAKIFDNYYGTVKSPVDNKINVVIEYAGFILPAVNMKVKF